MPDQADSESAGPETSAPPLRARPGYAFLRMLCRIGFKCYFRGRAIHLDRVPATGGAMLVANHQSFLDPPIAALSFDRECAYFARDSLFRNPILGRLFRYLNAVPVRRGAADVNAVKELLRRLRDGQAVLIFPEATRTRDGSIGTINGNSLAVAKRAGVPIIPTLIDGAFEALPRGAFFPRPYRLRVYYAEPITVAEMKEWPIEKIVEVVSQRLHDAKIELNSAKR